MMTSSVCNNPLSCICLVSHSNKFCQTDCEESGRNERISAWPHSLASLNHLEANVQEVQETSGSDQVDVGMRLRACLCVCVRVSNVSVHVHVRACVREG